MSKPNKLDFIESLRGIAALYVVIYHMLLITVPKILTPSWLDPFILQGGQGVSLFYIVSAYTLCLSSESRTGEPNGIFNFFIRRFFRIAPLFYLWILISATRDNYLYGSGVNSFKYLINFSFIFNLIPGKADGIAWASWSIGVEMLFYCAFPILFYYSRTLTRSIVSLFIAFVIAYLWKMFVFAQVDPALASTYHYLSFGHQLPIFMIGLVTYRLKSYLTEKRLDSNLLLSYSLLGIFMLATINFMYGSQYTLSIPTLYYRALTIALLVLSLSIKGHTFFVNRVTKYFGRISYSVYLTHATIVYFMAPLYEQISNVIQYKALSFTLSFIVTLIVVVPISQLTYKYVEIPGTNLGRMIINNIRAKRALQRA